MANHVPGRRSPWPPGGGATGLRAVAAFALVLGLVGPGCEGGGAPPDFAVAGRSTAAKGSGGGRPAAQAPVRTWSTLQADGIHDPTNPALARLQQPESALSALPPANEGNQVDWVAALRDRYIEPRTNIFPETKIKVIDLDILMTETAGMAVVRFPHRPHTEWLDCENCHDKIFKAEAGANDFGMLDILQGNYCGQCHGAVSFPLTQCHRCHSVLRSELPYVGGIRR